MDVAQTVRSGTNCKDFPAFYHLIIISESLGAQEALLAVAGLVESFNCV